MKLPHLNLIINTQFLNPKHEYINLIYNPAMVKLPRYLYRDVRAGELLELFMVSAITALLINRFILSLLGYPSIGGSKLHISHMLWGGLLMAIGLILMMAFLGYRVRRLSSIISGVGFGLFIDELGKFITRDNNYFFRPAIALIYLIFIGMFFAFRSLGKKSHLSPEEYLLNALNLAEEAVISDLSSPERRRALEYLQNADKSSPLTHHLYSALKSFKATVSDDRNWLQKWIDWVLQKYDRIIRLPQTISTIDAIFIIKALLFPIALIGGPIDAVKDGLGSTQAWMTFLQLVSSSIAGGFVVAGVIKIRASRIRAYELFSQSLLIDIFVTQFFSFYLSQFRTLFILFINVSLYFALKFLIRQESRLEVKAAKAQ
jgi:hypothetical protein